MTFLFVKGTSIRCTPAQCSCMFPSYSPLSAVISGLPDDTGGVRKGRFDELWNFIPI